ncbi:MAG: hypothetical protein HY508_05385 [Acidobacteria bacterium]|nr:hypothetical protein [Acidobacteriota bacterium]
MVRYRTHRVLTCLTALAAAAPSPATARQASKHSVDVVGRYTNMRYTEEHAYGYAVELWRHENAMIGLFLATEGLDVDIPAGLLEKVTYDEKTGALSFEARLSIGVVYSKEYNGAPSRDLFRFRGSLKKNQLRGQLERLDLLEPHSAAKTEQIILRRKQSASDMTAFKSYADWRDAKGEILKFRGPKW